ncbi:MAG: MFS transporter [Pseudomonadota bacterium]
MSTSPADSVADTDAGYARLLATRRFGPLFGTQFLGAFNDNLLKQALVTLVTFRLVGSDASMINNLAAALFILPFFLFSPLAGQLSDHFPKHRVARLVKVAEVAIMIVAGIGFWLSSVPLLLTALALMGLHSAFFGPVKFGVLPELVPARELSTANALMAAGTFLAILLGNVGGVYVVTYAGHPWEPALWMGLVALLGLACAWNIPRLPAAAPDRRLEFHPWRELRSSLAFVRGNREALAAVIGIAWFWLVGAAYLTQLPVLARDIAHGDAGHYVQMLLAFSVGIGLGALLCGRLSRGTVRPRLAIAGLLLLALFAAEIVRLCVAGSPDFVWLIGILTCIGIAAGLYIVPLYTVLQLRSPVDSRARTFAAVNLLNALAMVLSSVLAVVVLVVLRGELAILYAVLLAGTLAVAGLLWRLLPRGPENQDDSANIRLGQ